MTRHLAMSAILVARLAAAVEATPASPLPEGEIPLSDADLRAITLQVLEKNPLLASSPGVKAAFASRGPGTTIEFADIVFYPHTESAGIKEAYQVSCRRESPVEAWACYDPTLRRYVKLETQTFELRVRGDLELEGIQALVQATRAIAQANTPAGAAIPEAAIMIFPVGHGYLVDWGSDEGYGQVTVVAQLRKDGNPAVAEDWRTELFRPEE